MVSGENVCKHGFLMCSIIAMLILVAIATDLPATPFVCLSLSLVGDGILSSVCKAVLEFTKFS